MLSLSLPGRVFLCLLPTDMRKSFDTLAGLVEQQLGQDPLAGDLFVFRSKRGDRLKPCVSGHSPTRLEPSP
jgi:transposase